MRRKKSIIVEIQLQEKLERKKGKELSEVFDFLGMSRMRRRMERP